MGNSCHGVKPSVVEGDLPLSFSLKFVSIFVHNSSSIIDPVSLFWVALKRSFPPAELEYKWYQFWWKVMMSEVEQRSTPLITSYGQQIAKGLRLV